MIPAGTADTRYWLHALTATTCRRCQHQIEIGDWVLFQLGGADQYVVFCEVCGCHRQAPREADDAATNDMASQLFRAQLVRSLMTEADE